MKKIAILFYVFIVILSAGHSLAGQDSAEPTGLSQNVIDSSGTDGIVRNLSEINSSSLLFISQTEKKYTKAPELDMDADVEITGMIVKTKFTQVFINPNKEWLEAVYVFPLSDTASVNRLVLTIKDRVIEGKVMKRAEAQATYKEAKENGKQAALVEEQRPNIFTTSVANIPPGEKITVTLEYVDSIVYSGGSYSFRFPLVITPRYNPKKEEEQKAEIGHAADMLKQKELTIRPVQGEKKASGLFNNSIGDPVVRLAPLLSPGEGLRNPVSIKVRVKPGFPIKDIVCLYHAANLVREADWDYTVTLENGKTPADRDFVLVWKPDRNLDAETSAFIEEKNGFWYSMVMIVPPGEGVANRMRRPREVIYIIDRSGSMGGASIEQAKKALTVAISKLSPDDTFDVISFSDDFTMLGGTCEAATEENCAKARDFVSRLQADRGTEMKPALLAAFNISHETHRFRQIMFITDGAVSNEKDLLGIIAGRIGEGRLFTVGIGSAPNTYFMRKAAEFGHGTFTFIGKASDVDEKMGELFDKTEQPVLTDLAIKVEGNASDLEPEHIPDLYKGEPIVVVAKLTGNEGLIRISGNYTEGTNGIVGRFNKTVPINKAVPGYGIGALWAGKKIESLLDKVHLGEPEDAIEIQVTNLALEHSLVTPYTSLVAVEYDSVRPKDDKLMTSDVPLNPPNGYKLIQSPGAMGNTGTPSFIFLFMGFAILCSAICFYIREKIVGKKQ